MPASTQAIELRGALVIDQMQPQFAATIAANSDGYFPIAGERKHFVVVIYDRNPAAAPEGERLFARTDFL